MHYTAVYSCGGHRELGKESSHLGTCTHIHVCHLIPATLYPPVSPWDQVDGDVLLQGNPLLASAITRAMPRGYLYGEHYRDYSTIGERVFIVWEAELSCTPSLEHPGVPKHWYIPGVLGIEGP